VIEHWSVAIRLEIARTFPEERLAVANEESLDDAGVAIASAQPQKVTIRRNPPVIPPGEKRAQPTPPTQPVGKGCQQAVEARGAQAGDLVTVPGKEHMATVAKESVSPFSREDRAVSHGGSVLKQHVQEYGLDVLNRLLSSVDTLYPSCEITFGSDLVDLVGDAQMARHGSSVLCFTVARVHERKVRRERGDVRSGESREGRE
jgi:hypothetical protein